VITYFETDAAIHPDLPPGERPHLPVDARGASDAKRPAGDEGLGADAGFVRRAACTRLRVGEAAGIGLRLRG